MLTKQFNGLWFLFDAKEQKIYAYEKDPQHPLLWLGTVDSGTEQITLRPDWHQAYQERLSKYREQEKPKSRVPAAA
jgi:hypothetical protein